MNIWAFAEKVSSVSASGSKLFSIILRGWKPFSRVLTFSLMDGILVPRKCLSVSLEKGTVWVVLGWRFLSKIKIKGARKYVFEEDRIANPESLASSVSLAIKELKASRIAISLNVPRDWMIVRTVDLPVAVKETISDVVAYELDRLTPLSAENAYYDFRIVGEQEGRLKLIIAAVRSDMIDRYREALKKERIDVDRLTVNLFGLVALCKYLENCRETVCVQVDSFGYEGGLVRDGLVTAFSAGMFQDGNVSAQKGAVIEGIGSLLEKARDDGFSGSVFLYTMERTPLVLDREFEVPVKVIFDDEVRRKFYTDIANISPGAGGGVVDSLWANAKGLNLLEKGVAKKTRVPVLGSVMLIMLFAAALIPYFLLPLQREEKRLVEIGRQVNLRKDEVRKVEGLRKDVEALAAETESIDRFKGSEPLMLDMLKELTNVLPKTVWLTRTRLTDATADIEGYASSASEILPKLEQSKLFKKVEFASPTIRDTRMNADRFVIKMEIEGFEKAEAARAKEHVGEGLKVPGEKPKDGKKK